jgi:hypothetical protein
MLFAISHAHDTATLDLIVTSLTIEAANLVQKFSLLGSSLAGTYAAATTPGFHIKYMYMKDYRTVIDKNNMEHTGIQNIGLDGWECSVV